MAEDIDILKRKLAQTEARLLSNLLLSAEQVLIKEQYTLLCKQYESNQSLDLLEMERNIANSSKEMAESLEELHEAVGHFREAKTDFDRVERGEWSFSDNENPEQVYNRMIRARERMFSLFDEHEMKRKMSL